MAVAFPHPDARQHPQATVEVDAAGAFVDCGRWREKGVTHWHLLYEEWQLADNPTRFDNERVRAAVQRPTAVAFSVQEALDWLEKSMRDVVARSTNREHLLARAGLRSEDDWRSRAETTFFSLMHGHVAGGGLLISEGRTADSLAYPMTAAGCTSCLPSQPGGDR